MRKTSRNSSPQTGKSVQRQAALGLCLAAAIALAGVCLFSSQLLATETETAAAAPARPAMPVETLEVKVARSDQQLLAVGTLRSNESVVISAEIAGRIEEISFKEGGTARSGQPLVRLDSAVFQAELDRAEAGRSLSEDNYRRAEALLKEHSVSELERDEAYAQWQLDEATTRLAGAHLNKATVKAPFDGSLGLRQVSVGDYVQPGQPLVNLEDTSSLKIDFQVPEKHAAKVRIGQAVYVETEAYPGQVFAGKVYAINPLVNEQSRSLAVRGLLGNSDNRLKPGLFAKVSLTLASKADALFIPEQALIPKPAAQLVFKVVDGKAQMVPVTTGQRIKGWVEVTSGLGVGDVVVTGGHQKIGPGSPVHALPADPALFSQLDVESKTSTKDNG